MSSVLRRESRRGLFARAFRRVRNGQPVKLRIPDKIAAVKELTKMCGWAHPNRIELSARDTLADFIDSIREAPRRPAVPVYAEDNRERTAI